MVQLVPYYPLAPLIFVVAAIYFGLAMSRHVRVFAAAQPSRPFDRPIDRAIALGVHVFGQVRMFRDVRPALMHLAIFYGFLAITVISANYFSFGLVESVLSLPLDALPWRLALVGQNIISVLVIVAIAYALVRRLVTRPRRLTLSVDALVILLLIGGVVLSGLFADAFLIAGHGDPYGGAAVISALPAGWLAASQPPAVLDAWFAVSWWGHALLVAAFLAYLPRSKHLHIVTSAFNVFFRKLEPRGQLPALDIETSERFGLRTLPDLGWKDLLDGFTCTECGRCQEACPAWAVGKVLNPKTFIMGIRDMATDAEVGMPLIPEGEAGRLAGLTSGPNAAALARPIVDAAIPYEAVWDCVTCGACVEACPVQSSTSTRSSGCAAPWSSRNHASRPSSPSRCGTWSRTATRGECRARSASTGHGGCPSTCRWPPRWRRPGGSGRSRSSTGSAARPPSTSATARWRVPS